jgi:hypothetical protein
MFRAHCAQNIVLPFEWFGYFIEYGESRGLPPFPILFVAGTRRRAQCFRIKPIGSPPLGLKVALDNQDFFDDKHLEN